MPFTEYFIGKRERISIVDETSYGSGGTMSSGGFIPGLDCRIEPNFSQEWQEILSAGDDDRTVQNRVVGDLKLPFTLSFKVSDWRFLKYAGYGSIVNAGSNPYTHTFSLANTVQSFKLEWARRHTTASVITLVGCLIKKVTLRFQRGGAAGEGQVMAFCDCVARNYSKGTSVTTLANTVSSSTPFHYRHTKLTLESSEIVEVQGGELTIDNGIDEDDSRYANSTQDRLLSEPIPKVHRIDGRASIVAKDATFLNQWDGAAALSGTNKLEFIRGASDNIVLTLASVRVGMANAPTVLEGPQVVDLVFNAKSFSSLVATDAVAAY